MRYEGFWKSGKREGKGKQITKDGKVKEGIWHDDALSDD